jgi:hypothetical protein
MADHDRTRILRALILAAATAGVPRSAQAYEPTQTMDGQPLRWFVRPEPIPFHTAIVPAHANIPAVDLPALVQAAYDQWRDRAPCSTVPVFVHAGTTNDTSSTFPETPADLDNLVVFVTSADEWLALGQSPTVLASAFVRYAAATGEIIDADIAVNAASFVFSVDDAAPQWTHDLLTVIQHETGHALGLAHSTNEFATMRDGYPEPTLRDPIPGRSLATDDLDGICASYSDVPVHVPPDVTPPTLHHDPVATVAQGHAAPIEADITDESGVAFAYLHYRAHGVTEFTRVELASDASDGAGRYRGEIPSTATDGASFEYYLSAVDDSRQANTVQDPPAASDTVHRIAVAAEPAHAIETSSAETEVADAIATSPDGGGEAATTPDASAAETSPAGAESGCAGGLAQGDGGVALGLLCVWLCMGCGASSASCRSRRARTLRQAK